MTKNISLKKLLLLLNKIRKENKKIVFTNGCFDIIHAGHIKLLEKCKKLGDVVIVGLNSDSSIKRIKGRLRPVNKLKDRLKVLSAIIYVDYIVVFNEDTPYRIIKLIRPDFLVKGGDYAVKDIVGREFASKVVRVNLLKGRSTTGIIKALKKC